MTTRRVGAETSRTRALLLDRTEQLMINEGYAAVTYRRVAVGGGVTPGLVQYYFPTLDDLFIALLRRDSQRNIDKLSKAVAANPQSPVRAVWEFGRDEVSAALMMEFMALGNHRKAIRAEIAEVTRRSREEQIRILTGTAAYRLTEAEIQPAALSFLLAGIPKLMLLDEELGISLGHAEALALIERQMSNIQPDGTPGSL
ncbi:MAG TPA: TetR/AcrR family transcriptional regulator [Acidimicrobiales bacterium]|nr:TetR/AcrR family transcriptional regulator [Acidimicrobiales bacterium]